MNQNNRKLITPIAEIKSRTDGKRKNEKIFAIKPFAWFEFWIDEKKTLTLFFLSILAKRTDRFLILKMKIEKKFFFQFQTQKLCSVVSSVKTILMNVENSKIKTFIIKFNIFSLFNWNHVLMKKIMLIFVIIITIRAVEFQLIFHNYIFYSRFIVFLTIFAFLFFLNVYMLSQYNFYVDIVFINHYYFFFYKIEIFAKKNLYKIWIILFNFEKNIKK